MEKLPLLIQEYNKSLRCRFLMVMIPEKNGRGYLETPLGNHESPLTQLISDLNYDCFTDFSYVGIIEKPSRFQIMNLEDHMKIKASFKEVYGNTKFVSGKEIFFMADKQTNQPVPRR